MKVAVADIGVLMKKYWKMPSVEERLNEKGDEVRDELERLKEKSIGLYEKVKEHEAMVKSQMTTDEQKAKSGKLLEEAKRELNRAQKRSYEAERRLRNEVRQFQQMEQSKLLKEISDKIQAFGKENGYAYILDHASDFKRPGFILYVDAGYDITDQLAEYINKDAPKDDEKTKDAAEGEEDTVKTEPTKE